MEIDKGQITADREKDRACYLCLVSNLRDSLPSHKLPQFYIYRLNPSLRNLSQFRTFAGGGLTRERAARRLEQGCTRTEFPLIVLSLFLARLLLRSP